MIELPPGLEWADGVSPEDFVVIEHGVDDPPLVFRTDVRTGIVERIEP